MPGEGSWKPFDARTVASEQDQPGAYEIADLDENVIFIGSAPDVRSRLKAHFDEPVTSCIRTHGARYNVEYGPDFESRERHMKKLYRDIFGEDPKCNQGG
jgi:hypothetical protein